MLFRSIVALIGQCQDEVNSAIAPLVAKYRYTVQERVTVPFVGETQSCSDEELRELEKEADADISPSIESQVIETKADIDKALKNINERKLEKVDEIDEMNYLFDDDYDDDDDDCDSGTAVTDSSRLADAAPGDVSSRATLDDIIMQADVLRCQLRDVCCRVLEMVMQVNMFFFLAYDALDTDDGFDVVVASTHDALFADLQPQLDIFFRSVVQVI